MKIIIVGASGTIGKPLTEALKKDHEVITASAHSGEIKLDITSAESIKKMYETIGSFDALVCAAGGAAMGPLDEMKEEEFYKGIKSKLMGQVNLVLIGQHYINVGGSFTLISGILAEDPIKNGTSLSMVNNAVNGFVIGAAIDLKKSIRINVVSPALVEDSKGKLGKFFPGHEVAPMDKVVNAYKKSVEGGKTGEIIKVHG